MSILTEPQLEPAGQLPPAGMLPPAGVAKLTKRLRCPVRDCGGAITREQPGRHTIDGKTGDVVIAQCAFCDFRQTVLTLSNGQAVTVTDFKRAAVVDISGKLPSGEPGISLDKGKRPHCRYPRCRKPCEEGGLCEEHNSLWRAACAKRGEPIDRKDFIETARNPRKFPRPRTSPRKGMRPATSPQPTAYTPDLTQPPSPADTITPSPYDPTQFEPYATDIRAISANPDGPPQRESVVIVAFDEIEEPQAFTLETPKPRPTMPKSKTAKKTSETCAVHGCYRDEKTRHLCGMHYQRYRKHHKTHSLTEWLELANAQAKHEGQDTCWVTDCDEPIEDAGLCKACNNRRGETLNTMNLETFLATPAGGNTPEGPAEDNTPPEAPPAPASADAPPQAETPPQVATCKVVGCRNNPVSREGLAICSDCAVRYLDDDTHDDSEKSLDDFCAAGLPKHDMPSRWEPNQRMEAKGLTQPPGDLSETCTFRRVVLPKPADQVQIGVIGEYVTLTDHNGRILDQFPLEY